MRNEKNDPILIQKIIMRVCPIMVCNLILKCFQDGGFDGARYCDGKLLISLSAMHKYWPNWLVPLTKQYTGMPVCEKCGVVVDVQESLNLKRAKIVKRIKYYVLQIEYGPDKDAYNKRVKKYKYKIMVNKELESKKVLELAYAIFCDAIVVNGKKSSRFSCVIGECK